MVVSLGFSMVLLSLSLFTVLMIMVMSAFPELTADGFTGQKRVLADTRPTLGEAECEEDPCSLRMHTTFGFQRGMMGSCCTGEAMIRQEVVLQLVDH